MLINVSGTFIMLPKLPVFLLISLLLSFPALAAKSGKTPEILTSIKPLGLLAKGVVGDYGNVDVLLSTNTSPHHYSMTVSERKKLIEADIVLWIDDSLEAFLSKPLDTREGITIKAMSLVRLQKEGSNDPHIWLNPQLYLPIIDALLLQLEQVAPEHRERYQQNAERLKQSLQVLDAKLLKQSKALAGHTFVVSHPAYDHFTKRYGFHQGFYVRNTPEHKASAKRLYKLRQLQGVYCVFEEEGFPDKGARQLAADLDIPVYSLDLFGSHIDQQQTDSLVQFMAAFASDFQQCFQAAQ